MATGAAGVYPPPGAPHTSHSPIPQQWYDPQQQQQQQQQQPMSQYHQPQQQGAPHTTGQQHVGQNPLQQQQQNGQNGVGGGGGEIRSVTPAMNNTRGASYPSRIPSPQQYRSTTPNRYYGAYNTTEPQPNKTSNSGPSSTGLIRLTLRKPMGIVFEPMYDPNQPSVQRGVRICDLPRTGAAALSRKLEVGDELLSINDKTMSRLTFDEIMDFIIEADPDQVNLLFRRPRRETLQARNHIKSPNNNNSASVKWVDDEEDDEEDEETNNTSKKKKSKKKKETSKKKKRDDDTLETAESMDNRRDSKHSNKRKNTRRVGKDYHESESFLDLLIDTICANPDAVCKSDRRRDDDYDSYDEDDRTFNSQDDSTYVTYDESEKVKETSTQKKKKQQSRRDEESITTDNEDTEDDTLSEDERIRRKKEILKAKEKPLYQDESTYDEDPAESTTEISKPLQEKKLKPSSSTPLGLAANVNIREAPPPPPVLPHVPDEDEGTNPAPIKEVQYDQQVDHGADVSVMESLGGPSLLIEKQRQAAKKHLVPPEITKNFGLDYPSDFGLTREETILKDPQKFYTFVVRGLLEEHEPEKVRLLDKLLAKYKGREDHLVQKLSVRYNKEEEKEEEQQRQKQSQPPEQQPRQQQSQSFGAFSDAVNHYKDSEDAARNVEKAHERAEATFGHWPEKETKEEEPQDALGHGPSSPDEEEESVSESGSEYSTDSIDGTSPAVIAQVSELLNYVYGKTSVPGQIDRVSTIMRAYEGREAVLLELLETKALIKANSEKENAANLPSFLRNSPALQHAVASDGAGAAEEVPQQQGPPSPMDQQQNVGAHMIGDDISSMSGVSSPAAENPAMNKSVHDVSPVVPATPPPAVPKPPSTRSGASMHNNKTPSSPSLNNRKKMEPEKHDSITKTTENKNPERKKKKGLFGGLFGKKNKNKNGRTMSSK